MPKATQRISDVRERAVEIGLYLPLGAYSRVRDQLTDLNRRRIRKTFEDLIDRGQDRLQPIERVVRRRSGDVRKGAKSAAENAQKTAEKTVKKTTRRASAAATTAQPKFPRVATPKTASDLPIESYDSLTASEIVTRLQGLTQTDLASVYKYERANEARSTILESIEGKIVALPISGYDALTVDELNSRLDRLSKDDLKKIRRYEEDTKARTTVLDKIDSLLA